MRRTTAILFSLVLPLALSSCRTAMMPETGFLDRSITIGGTVYPYVVYVPEHRAGERLPIVLFLHGSGERGNDGLRQTAVGIGSAIRWNRERVRMIVVMPQCPENERWLGEPLQAASAALERSIHEFQADPHRVILTGLSLGGYGAYALAFEHPDRFAALVPVCAGILGHEAAHSVRQLPATAGVDDPYAMVAARIRTIPAWIFHGADDPIIPVSEAREMAAALRHAGGDVRYTELPGTGHNAWDPAYGNEDLWRWMLAARR